jgi:hypothetical protein
MEEEFLDFEEDKVGSCGPVFVDFLLALSSSILRVRVRVRVRVRSVRGLEQLDGNNNCTL